MKACTVCGVVKSLDDFYQRSNRPAGQLKSMCKKCDSDRTKAYRLANPGRHLVTNRNWAQRNRLVVLTYYSGGTFPHCACCGESTLTFLALDHINDDGYIERSQPGYSQAGFFGRLIRAGFPPRFQVLCHNCNFAKKLGPCPHRAVVDIPALLDRPIAS